MVCDTDIHCKIRTASFYFKMLILPGSNKWSTRNLSPFTANGGKVNRCSLMSGKKIIIFHGSHSQ